MTLSLPRSPSDIRSAVTRAALLALSLVTAACAGTSSTSVPTPQTVADIASYPPMPNDTPPGASASATATAAALGRGVNFGNMLEAPSEGAWGLTVTDDFIDKAAAAGFKSVRLPVRWSNHASADAPFTIDAAFLSRVDGVVDKLLAKGLVVVLNMHHYRHSMATRSTRASDPSPRRCWICASSCCGSRSQRNSRDAAAGSCSSSTTSRTDD
jgi:hypothetical protein